MKTVTMLMCAGMMLLGLGAKAADPSYPSSVSRTSTELNTWTSNFEGVMTAAAKTGYPVLLIVVNGLANGEGCIHCKSLMKYTINTDLFRQTVKDTRFYMVFINCMEGGPGYRADGADFYEIYSNANYLPVCCIFNSEGRKVAYMTYSQSDRGWMDAAATTSTASYLRARLRALSKSTTTLTFSAASATMTAGGTYTGTVTRSGGAATSGKVTLSLSGDKSAQYTLAPTSLDFGTADGSKTFTVTGPATSTGIVSDSLTVTLAATGYENDIAYATKTLTLSVKDSKVGKTLAEFKAANASFASLAAKNGTWYAPKGNDSSLTTDSVAAGGKAVLAWTAPSGGELRVSGTASGSGTITVSSSAVKSEPYVLTSDVALIGVAKGDVVTFTCTPGAGETAETFTLNHPSFAAKTISLSPADGTVLMGPDIEADPSKATLSWTSGFDDYEILAGSSANISSMAVKATGKEASVNARDAGVLPAGKTGTFFWGVKAKKTSGISFGEVVVSATASIVVSDAPVFAASADAYTLYTKTAASLAVSATGAGTVTYSAKNLPSGLSLDKATGEITGTPNRLKSNVSVTITAKNDYGSATKTITITTKSFSAANLKAKYAGLVFDGSDNIVGTVAFSISSSAKGKVKFVLADGSKAAVKGHVEVVSDGFRFVPDAGSAFAFDRVGNLWVGEWGSRKVIAQTITATAANYYTCGLLNGDSPCGYLTATLKKNGKASVKGRVDGATKVSSSGQALVLTAAQIQANLPSWSNGKPAFFIPLAKKASSRVIAGGMMIDSANAVSARVLVNGSRRDGAGALFVKPLDLKRLGGTTLDFADGAVTVPVIGKTASKIAAGKNDYSATLKGNKKTGVFSGACKVGGVKRKFEGVFVMDGAGVIGCGVAITGAAQGVWIE